MAEEEEEEEAHSALQTVLDQGEYGADIDSSRYENNVHSLHVAGPGCAVC